MMKLLMLSLAPALSLAMLAGETVVIPNARCRGFIGIGIMGRGMVHRLLEADVPLVIWNRNLTKAYELRDEWQQIAAQEAGPLAEHLDPAVTVVDTPRQVVEACWRTYLMLSTPEAAASVYEMPDGVLSGVKEGKEIIDCATLRPEDMITNGAAVTQRGGRFLEAPVSGSKGPAEQGTLVFMTGGSVGSAMVGGLGGVTGLPWALAILGVLPLVGMTALIPILRSSPAAVLAEADVELD